MEKERERVKRVLNETACGMTCYLTHKCSIHYSLSPLLSPSLSSPSLIPSLEHINHITNAYIPSMTALSLPLLDSLVSFLCLMQSHVYTVQIHTHERCIAAGQPAHTHACTFADTIIDNISPFPFTCHASLPLSKSISAELESKRE